MALLGLVPPRLKRTCSVTPESKAAKRLAKSTKPPRKFREFVDATFQGFQWIRARKEIAWACQALVDGTLKDENDLRYDRLAILAPAQSGKSTLVELMAAWLLEESMRKAAVGVACYNSTLAQRFSLFARRFFEDGGGTFAATSEAVHHWYTTGGGEFWCRGLQSGTSGNPLWVGILDDLDKDAQHALSSPQQSFVREFWYGPTWRNRRSSQSPRFLEVMIGTPHAAGDSQDFILRDRSSGSDGVSPGWYVVALPVIYDPGEFPIDLPPDCTLHPDWREVGEALAPELPKFTVEAIEAARISGAFTPERWAAIMMMCRLPEAGGGLMDRAWFWPLDSSPFEGEDRVEARRRVMAYDFAYTEGGTSDWTVGTLMAERADTGRLVIEHVARGHKGPDGLNRLVAAMALVHHALYGPAAVTVRIPEDPGGGKGNASGVESYLRRIFVLLGLSMPPVVMEKPRGSKRDRANAPGGPVARGAPPRRKEAVSETNRGSFEIVAVKAQLNLRDILSVFGGRVAGLAGGAADLDRQELLAIEALADAVFSNSVREAAKLNLGTGDWWTPTLDVVHQFTGQEGKRDDEMDSLVDVTAMMTRPQSAVTVGRFRR